MKNISLKSNFLHDCYIILAKYLALLMVLAPSSYAYSVYNNTNYTVRFTDSAMGHAFTGMTTNIKPHQLVSCSSTADGCFGNLVLNVESRKGIWNGDWKYYPHLCNFYLKVNKGDNGHSFIIQQIRDDSPDAADVKPGWCNLSYKRMQAYIVTQVKSIKLTPDWSYYADSPSLLITDIKVQGGNPYGLPGENNAQGFLDQATGSVKVGIAMVGNPNNLIKKGAQPAVAYISPQSLNISTAYSVPYGININKDKGVISWAVVASYLNAGALNSIYLPTMAGDPSCQSFFSLGIKEKPYRIFSVEVKPWEVGQTKIFNAEIQVFTPSTYYPHVYAELYNCSLN